MNKMIFAKVSLMLAVNNPDNGRHTGKVGHIHIGDELLELEGKLLTCKQDGIDVLVLGSERIPLQGYYQWVGNWCWDQAIIRAGHLTRVLRELMDNDWDCIAGESSLFEMWANGEVPTWEQLVPLL